MNYCKRCLYPFVSVNILMDDDCVCSACNLQDEFDELSPEFWQQREALFSQMVEAAQQKTTGNYDCIVPVSGGKDSYYQVDMALRYGLKPLLVTYHGNNYLPVGQRNLDRMRHVFNADQHVFSPSVETLKKLNRIGFRLMGDMNWHCHAGIKTYPMQVAVRLGIPLVIWGEVTWSVSGMFSAHDYVQYNKRTVFEHDMRGFTLRDMLDQGEDLCEKDLAWLVMPSDLEFEAAGCKGIYIGNFFKWDPNAHAEDMRKRFGFEFAKQPFERTYRMISNLDDMHENGIHDYMKFVKFGYGRVTDHASKDIRTGYITRLQGIEKVREYDHVKPRRDLERWLDYVDISEDEFDLIADSFRDPRVWAIENGEWVKDTVWGERAAFGPAKIPKDQWNRYQR